MKTQQKMELSSSARNVGYSLPGPPSEKDQFLLQSSEFVANFKSFPKCGHKLNELAYAKLLFVMKQIFGLFRGRNTVGSSGYWVEGGSLVYVPTDRGYEVPRLLQQHREQEAETARLRAMARVGSMAR